MVADDDRSLLDALSARLGASGFDVHVAQDGYMAVQAVRRLRPDVVLLDVGMPAGDGFSVHERVRQFLGDGDDTQFVYMTGSREAGVLQTARARHAYALVPKPFDGRELVTVLRGAVRRRRSRQAAALERAARDLAAEAL